MIKTLAVLLSAVSIVAGESTTAAAVTKDDHKDQKAEPSILDNYYRDLGSVSSSLLSPDSWKPIAGPTSQHTPESSASSDIKTITLTKHVPVPYHVTVEKRVPVKVEVPVDKPIPVYVPRPYHVIVEKKVPYHVGVPVPQPYAVERHVPVPVKVPVDKPVPVAVPQPYPVFMYRKVPYTIERHVPYPVRVPYFRPYPVHVPVEKRIPVPVEKVVPYPVHVAVERPVPVHVEKPVPVPIEKIVPYTVEKIVPVPYKVPIKIPVEVHVPSPEIGHYSSHAGSGTNELYSATDNSQQHQAYQADETREAANNAHQGIGGQHSEAYAQSARNQWPQLGSATHHQSDTAHSHFDGHIRFPREHEGTSAASNIQSQDQESAHHQIGTYFEVDQGHSSQSQYRPGHGHSQYGSSMTHSQINPETSSQSQSYNLDQLKQQQHEQQHKQAYEQQKYALEEQIHAHEQQKHAYEQQKHAYEQHKYAYEQQKHDHEQQKHAHEQQKHAQEQQKHAHEQQKHAHEQQKHAHQQQKHVHQQHKHAYEHHKYVQEQQKQQNHNGSGSTRQQHQAPSLQPDRSTLAEFEKRLKDGHQESYSKSEVNLGPTAFTNTIQHG